MININYMLHKIHTQFSVFKGITIRPTTYGCVFCTDIISYPIKHVEDKINYIFTQTSNFSTYE